MKITLQAGADETISLEGYGIYIRESDGPILAELREIDGRVDQSGVLLEGQGLQGGGRFESVRIVNTHTAAQTIDFYIGPRLFVDNRDTGIVTVTPPGSVVALADKNVAAYSSYTFGASGRAELHLYATGAFRYGNGAGASAGVLVPAGVVAVINTAGAVTVYNTEGIATDFYASEVV